MTSPNSLPALLSRCRCR